MSCLSDLASLIIHGANGTCGPSGEVSSVTWLAVAALLLCFGLVFAFVRNRRFTTLMLTAIVVIASIPGWRAALLRADVPPALADSTTAVGRLRQQLARFSAEHRGCVVIEENGCVACDPIAREAVTPTLRCERPAIVELGPAALLQPCREDAGRLRCGVAP